MDNIDWLGIGGFIIGVIGLVVACWQWHESKKQGSNLVAFLHGLKACDLPPKAVEQVNDMLARLDPQK
jgi:hypothetical protein